MDRIIVTCPDAVVAVLPYVVGYWPGDSLVIAWTRDDELVLTERLDIPADDVDEAAFLAQVIEPALQSAPTDATIVVSDGRDWDDDPDDDEEYREAAVSHTRVMMATPSKARAQATTSAPSLPYARVVDAVRTAVERRGIDVRDVIYTRGRRWWSYLCHDQCCPPQGRLVDPEVDLVMRARFALAGIVPLASRSDVIAQYAPDVAAHRRIAVRLAAAIADRDARSSADAGQGLATWRAAQLVGPCADILRPSVADIDDDVIAELLCALDDNEVRDDVVRRIASTQPLTEVVGALARAVRVAPPGYIAPVATCAAIAAWLHGDGVRARIALDRAFADGATYPLALMVDAAVTHGIPPRKWKAALLDDTDAPSAHFAA